MKINPQNSCKTWQLIVITKQSLHMFVLRRDNDNAITVPAEVPG